MGLIKALSEATSSALGDQFKEFVNCPTISKNVLIQRGLVNHGKGNKNPSEGVISNGSTIVVPQGMAMMIIENGEIKSLLLSPVLSILIQVVNLVYLLVDLEKVSLIHLKQ